MDTPAPQPTILIPPPEDKPPKRVKPEPEPQIGPKGPGTTSTPSGKPSKFHRELAEFMSMPAMAFEIKGDPFVAYVWTIRSEKFAFAVADLADKNPSFKRKLNKLMEGGAYGQVAMTGLALVVPILAYYGLYPDGMFNPFAVNPDELAEFEAMMAKRGNRENHNGFTDPSIPVPIT